MGDRAMGDRAMGDGAMGDERVQIALRARGCTEWRTIREIDRAATVRERYGRRVSAVLCRFLTGAVRYWARVGIGRGWVLGADGYWARMGIGRGWVLGAGG
ncbi:MAG: hypothetical protein A2V70_03405 [Planctomycetes bacterium RBG_13_63_9]|nr:MAG: hypothetical protein A2V70_03405 [Planctomycetes bacterium RBG_13_63_9]